MKHADFDYDIIKPLLKGREIKRYSKPKELYKIIFPYEIIGDTATLITEKKLRKSYPKVWDYLLECEEKLRGRENGKMNKDEWWAYVYPKNLDCFEQTKILTQVLSLHSSLTLDFNDNYYFVGGGTAGGYGITLKKNSEIEYKYLLTLLNSKLLEWFIHSYASSFKGDYFAYNRSSMEILPIIEIDKNSQPPFIAKADIMLTKHKDLQEIADEFLDWLQDEYDVKKLSNKLTTFYELDEDVFIKEVKRKSSQKRISPPQRKELINYSHEYKDKINPILQTIDETDKAIDEMVYKLYGLTEEEIRIVEES